VLALMTLTYVRWRFASWTITAIAFEAGFGDLSYFNRVFCRLYAASPSEVRAKA
jgi:AraC-like DNA-binding protein